MSYPRLPFRATLPLSLLFIAGLACNVGPGAATPDIGEAVRQTVEAIGPAITTAPELAAATVAPPTESEPTATLTLEPPTPTVTHVTIPGSPGGVNSFMTDRSSAALASERRSIGDNFDILMFERPFTTTTMDYQGYLDITRGELSAASPWIYVTVSLEQAPPAGSTAWYAVEVDTDIDGRGDFLVVGAAPGRTDWTTDGVQVFRDSNNDVGGANPITANAPPQSGNGYDDRIFDQGQGTDPDLAWIRISPSDPARVQIAFKNAAIGSPDKFVWGVAADDAVKHADWFDYNDHFSPSEAGSPTSGSSLYPVKALASVDNTCRWAYGFTPVGTEPGICPVPPTPTPKPEGSIAGRVTNLSGGFHGGTVKLGQGSCASSGFKTTSINSTGYYEFTGLPAGTFCVTVDTSSLNPSAPYGWAPDDPAFPIDADPYRTVTLGTNENKTNVNFHYVDVPG